MTDRQFEKRMKDIGADCTADMSDDPDWSLESCAYDLAECALYDEELWEYCKRRWPGISRKEMKFTIADFIC